MPGADRDAARDAPGRRPGPRRRLCHQRRCFHHSSSSWLFVSLTLKYQRLATVSSLLYLWQFLLREGDRGKPKSKLIASRLNELSPFADVRTIPGALTLDLLLDYHASASVVVFASSQLSREELIAYNEFCRVQSPPIGFVLAESRGVLGFVFTDFSEQHIAEDNDALLEFRILTKRTQITDPATAILYVKEPHLDSSLGVADSVCLRCDSGDEAGKEERLVCEVVAILSAASVQLRMPSCRSSDAQRDAFQKHLKAATHMKKLRRRSTPAHHQSLRERIIDPGEIAFPIESPELPQSDPKNAAVNAHLAMQGLYGFRQEFGSYPESRNRDHLQQMLECIQKFRRMCDKVDDRSGRSKAKTPCVTSAEVDEDIIRRLLCSPASEFHALSALIAGYAAIQVMKFTGVSLSDVFHVRTHTRFAHFKRHSVSSAGKMGAPLGPQSQFLYFDLLGIVPPEIDPRPAEFATSAPRRENALIALFGASFLQRLQQTVLSFVGLEAVNTEILKNALCLGVGSKAHIQVATDESDDDASHHVVDASTLSARVLLSPTCIGQSKQNALRGFVAEHFPTARLEFRSMTARNPPDDHESWSRAHIVCCDSLTLAGKLWVDAHCKCYEKPFIFTDQCQQACSVSTFAPHVTETFSESLIAPDKKANPQVFALDHLPRATSLPSVDKLQCHNTTDGFAGFEMGEILTRSRALFNLVFRDSIAQAIHFFSNAVAKSAYEFSQDDGGIASAWTIWSVVQRAHNAATFRDCVQEAWKLCEIIPMLCVDAADPHRGQQALFLSIDLENNPQHVQLIVSTACIVADSLDIQVPPVEDRRKILGKISSESTQFSLQSNPRTPSGILTSFQSASATHLLQLCERVQPIAFDAGKPEKLHSHFLQSLVNIQASVRNSPTLPDLSSLRGLSGDKADFLSVSTILGALAMLEVFKLLQSKCRDVRNYRFTLPNLANGGGLGAYILQRHKPQAPLQVRSMAMEATRGAPLRVIPENFTAWSKISIPMSKELQSVDAIVKYIQLKYQVEIHALVHEGRTLVSLDARRKRAGDLSTSVFEMVSRSRFPRGSDTDAMVSEDFGSPPFLLVDIVAVDAHGDVAFPPFRIQRAAMIG